MARARRCAWCSLPRLPPAGYRDCFLRKRPRWETLRNRNTSDPPNPGRCNCSAPAHQAGASGCGHARHPWRAGTTQFRSDWSAIWLYNPRMASSRHGFEEPGDVQDIRLVVDTIPTLAWSARPDGSADFFNQRWLDYTGLSAEQALGSGWQVAIHPDDLPRILKTFREALNSVKPYEVEGRFCRFDGEFRWFLFRASPLCDESGKVVKWYGTNTDIEDRKRAEDALRSHEQNLRLLVDTIPGHIVTTTPTGEIELLNRRVLEYFDKTPEELVNWRTSDAIHPDDLALTIAALTRAIQTGEPYGRG